MPAGRGPQMFRGLKQDLALLPARVWNAGLHRRMTLRPTVAWPLAFLPVLWGAQLIAPSAIWTGLSVALLSLYLFAYLWIRLLLPQISLKRRIANQVLVVGDVLEVETRVTNDSLIPVLWGRITDLAPNRSQVAEDRIFACTGQGTSQWLEKHACEHRGFYRVGPSRLQLGDPVGLFTGERAFPETAEVLIYPRVVDLPNLALPRQSRSGHWQHRRRLQATARAPTIREYTPADSLRFIHWPSTAHRGELMVTEFENEPGTRMTAVLNLYAGDQVGSGRAGSLETAIMVTGSLVAQTVNASQQRQCGLLCAEQVQQAVSLAPGQGAGHMWSVLRALASVNAGDVPLHHLLARTRSLLGTREEDSVMVVTPYPTLAATGSTASIPATGRPEDLGSHLQWIAELNALRQSGMTCGLILIRHPSQQGQEAHTVLHSLLGPVPIAILDTDDTYVPLITYRRRRLEYIATPFGGTAQIEVDEVVG